ncbi:MAG: RNA 2',3'-cyclic phosphodiesterase [Nanobdellota archaeon]
MRLFLALDCSDFKDALDPVVEKLKLPNIKPVSTYHLTLVFFPDAEPQDIMNSLELQVNPIQLKLDGVGQFGNRVIWAGVTPTRPIYDLKQQIDTQLSLRDERFHPHITLARIKGKAEIPHLTLPPAQATATLVLFKSTLTPTGPHYEKLHEF